MNKNSRKTKIIAVAAKLFKEKGYSAVTMRDIAEALGIKAASLYNHIQSKQEILDTIIIKIAEQFTTGMQSIVESNESTYEKLRHIIELHIDITIENTDALAALNNDWMHLEGNLSYFIQMRDAYENKFRSILKFGIVKGEIVARDPEIMLFSLLSTLRTLYLWYAKKGGIDAKTLRADMPHTLLKGIIK
ncbi:MAG: TetR/AcrR family transcriptional regulator [Flavobacteriaceae bacterium CG_4_8_14_3_um_filter_34_10]|nr:MAG: TetR/AcrR family transcriptional regulator [Flavobacteriaceae bacterium CG02_land_8_20_14_3_00_34_13]PIX09342.1 MAG: TetR/AcrR family transcriptional regulator [Flavobacteriaceae bacterium CG_4_8_14_3_um_filter_34_10]PJC06040.1 MAG: TetR/AcrR family transcriptional regulator [Flavobacteriaceae bacterium CG_4_9_14_0_8_um_filter_34_30]